MKIPFNLQGKIALIGGASDGIGKAIALQFAQSGAKVILLARTESKLQDLLSELPNSEHHYFVVDYSKTNSIQSLIDALTEQNIYPDIVVNNTGGPAPGPAHLAQPIDFTNAFQQHLVANQMIAQFAIPKMKENKYGRIINIISTSVKVPLPNLGVSNTIRGAVGNWAKTLANELAPYQITVNNILPGATNTSRLQGIISNKATKQNLDEEKVSEEMRKEIPIGRFANPEEIAYAALFLASDEASYITGINLPVDGGRTPSL